MKMFTHKGWFGFCPVYIHDIDSDEPTLDVRHWVFHPLFWFSLTMYQFAGLFVPEPNFPIMITGELAEKIPLKSER